MPARIATKIVCTIGPASSSPSVLGHMIRAGMDVARINFSHGTYEEHLKSIKTIRKVSHRLRRPVAILQDLPGPKLRVGKLASDPMHLRRLDTVTLTTKPSKARGKIPVAYPHLPKAVKKGDMIYLADGSLRLEVLRTSRDEEEIVKEADGVMVARGDLGVELSLERIPIVQKRIIFEANRSAKPVITATQMLESMISSPSPTRAEVTDIANAIIDGSDALMLSEETAIGGYPVEAVRVLQKVAQETERYLPKEITQQRRMWHENSQEDAIAFAACETALQISAAAIVTPTRTGKTARRVSKYRPPLPIVALTSHADVEKQLLLSWGVQTVRREIESTDTIFTEAEKTVQRLKLARKGNTIVIVSGDPKGPMGRTDLLKIQRVR